jgi:hypothetical protein
MRGSTNTTSSGRIKTSCYGKTPLQTFVGSVPLAKEKMLAA